MLIFQYMLYTCELRYAISLFGAAKEQYKAASPENALPVNEERKVEEI
jgi:hypothetical protein